MGGGGGDGKSYDEGKYNTHSIFPPTLYAACKKKLMWWVNCDIIIGFLCVYACLAGFSDVIWEYT